MIELQRIKTSKNVTKLKFLQWMKHLIGIYIQCKNWDIKVCLRYLKQVQFILTMTKFEVNVLIRFEDLKVFKNHATSPLYKRLYFIYGKFASS